MDEKIRKLLEDCRHEFETSHGLTVKEKHLEWELNYEDMIKKLDEVLGI